MREQVESNAAEQAVVAKSDTKKKKKEKKPSRVGKFFKEIISELKKVNWPTAKKVLVKTGVVLTLVVLFMLVVFGLDQLFALMLKFLTGLGE